MVLGLPDSGTPRLQDSQTPGLPNSGTPKLRDSQTPGLPDSQGVFRLGSSQQWRIFSSDYQQNLPMSEEETGDLGPGSGLVLQVHPYYCNTCQMTEMHCFTFERYFGSSKTSQSHFKVFCHFLEFVQKMCFQTNLKLHFLHLEFTQVNISYAHGVVFSLESIMALFTFWIL